MHAEGISGVDTVSHKAQMSPPVQLLQVLSPTGGRTGSLGERNRGKCGLVDNLKAQVVQANKAPLV